MEVTKRIMLHSEFNTNAVIASDVYLLFLRRLFLQLFTC